MKMDEINTRMLYKTARYLWETEKELFNDVCAREYELEIAEERDEKQRAMQRLDDATTDLEHIRVAIACVDAEFSRRVQDDK